MSSNVAFVPIGSVPLSAFHTDSNALIPSARAVCRNQLRTNLSKLFALMICKKIKYHKSTLITQPKRHYRDFSKSTITLHKQINCNALSVFL